MSARDQRNLLLEYRSRSSSEPEECDGEVANIILDNDPGHYYTFGTLYSGEVEGEEFIFSSGSGNGNRSDLSLTSPRDCTSTIRVDDQGQYWIRNDGGMKPTTSFYDTFVNSERVEGSEWRLLKSGDIISLGAPGTDWAGSGPPPHPIYRVKERIEQRTHNNCPKVDVKPESPFSNGLILSQIMSHLSVKDLKSARLVSKTWKGEASLLLEKKAKVSLTFFKPQDSTDVASYLEEMEGLKLQNLYIRLNSPRFKLQDHSRLVRNPLLLSSQEPMDNLMSDLRKLLNSSHNFSSLYFNCCAFGNGKSAFLPLVLTLQELGEKLVELKLDGIFPPRPKHLPLPPLPSMILSNLRKLTHTGVMKAKVLEKWLSHFVPLFTGSLEHFQSAAYGVAEDYLQEFLKHEMPNLREIEIEGSVSGTSLSSLLQLRTPLTLFNAKYYHSNRRPENLTLLENLLLKNAQSLKVLDIWISRDVRQQNMDVSVRFPTFPNLQELKLHYKAAPNGMRITWESGDLEYTKHFPSLRRLSVVNWFRRIRRGYQDEDDPVFNSFFSAVGRLEAVKEVRVLMVKARPRMDRIKGTFPNAALSFVCDAEDGYDSEEGSDED